MKKFIFIAIVFVTILQVNAQKKTNWKYNVDLTGGMGGVFVQQVNSADKNSTLYIIMPFPWNYSKTISTNYTTGISLSLDYKKVGIGSEILISYDNYKIICEGTSQYHFESRKWNEHYVFLKLPIYLKFNTFYGGSVGVGISNDILFLANYKGYFGEKRLNLVDLNTEMTAEEKENATPIYIDYYTQKYYVPNLYISVKSRQIKQWSVGLQYYRSLSEFRITETKHNRQDIINYYKSSLSLSLSYRFKQKELRKK